MKIYHVKNTRGIRVIWLCDVANPFTAAEIMVGYSLMLAQSLKVLTTDHPNTLAYFERLSKREPFQVATKAGG